MNRTVRKGHEKDKRKKCPEVADAAGSHEVSRDKELSKKFKLTQQDIKNHIDADKSFAISLEETFLRANRMMLRMAEKELIEPSSDKPL